ncbi:tRNA (guanine(9)-N(1))-methyltransferase [Mycoblastus sanguinarius]|nr:tRNA (guanine(9)-N(1))-methyltransferase [Mycoblastus sanguinarius]
MASVPAGEPGNTENLPMSKNQLKKLKRNQEWEANSAKRKAKRKEKHQEKKQRKRAAREEAAPTVSTIPKPVADISQLNKVGEPKPKTHRQLVQLPITLVLDCGFDDLMTDSERKSLASQVTRCYSDNHRAPYQAHLAVSSFGGHLKERFDGVLAGNYKSWKNVRFLGEDFVEAADQAKEWMRNDCGGKLAGVFENASTSTHQFEPEEIVYLTSDSTNTLMELRPYSTYIIGGLVDKNRHKGVCYKKAMDRGVKTAKLPIGDYMQMTSRFVLATNHVTEIMLRWLELGDWGKAFLQVVPKRKGGVLKETPIGANAEANAAVPGDDNADPSAQEDDQVAVETVDSRTEAPVLDTKDDGAAFDDSGSDDKEGGVAINHDTIDSRHQ